MVDLLPWQDNDLERFLFTNEPSSKFRLYIYTNTICGISALVISKAIHFIIILILTYVVLIWWPSTTQTNQKRNSVQNWIKKLYDKLLDKIPNISVKSHFSSMENNLYKNFIKKSSHAPYSIYYEPSIRASITTLTQIRTKIPIAYKSKIDFQFRKLYVIQKMSQTMLEKFEIFRFPPRIGILRKAYTRGSQ